MKLQNLSCIHQNIVLLKLWNLHIKLWAKNTYFRRYGLIKPLIFFFPYIREKNPELHACLEMITFRLCLTFTVHYWILISKSPLYQNHLPTPDFHNCMNLQNKFLVALCGVSSINLEISTYSPIATANIPVSSKPPCYPVCSFSDMTKGTAFAATPTAFPAGYITVISHIQKRITYWNNRINCSAVCLYTGNDLWTLFSRLDDSSNCCDQMCSYFTPFIQADEKE